MPIRKTGSAGGVIEVEDDGLIRKEAAAEPPWDDSDEAALDEENRD